MKTYKYKIYNQSNTIRIGNLLDDMWQVHAYFHKWQDQRYKDGFPYANYAAMCEHAKDLKGTTHPHWQSLPSQAIQAELERIDNAYQRFFNKLGVNPISNRAISLSLSRLNKLDINSLTIVLRSHFVSGRTINGDLIKCRIHSISTVSDTELLPVSR